MGRPWMQYIYEVYLKECQDKNAIPLSYEEWVQCDNLFTITNNQKQCLIKKDLKTSPALLWFQP